jgi:hypothetical protein
VPVFPGVTLKEIGISFGLQPTRFAGRVTLNVAGGLATIDGGVLVVFANDAYPYSYKKDALAGVDQLQTNTDRYPIKSTAIGVSGQVSLQVPVLGKVPLAKAYVFYISPAYFEFAGSIDLSILDDAVDVSGYIKGAMDLDRGRYNLGGGVHACADLPDPLGHQCLSVDAIVSSLGMGACAQIPNPLFPLTTLDAGFRYPWGGPLKLFLDDCYLGPVTVDDVRAGSANAASAGTSIVIAPGTPSTSITVQGSGSAPRIALSGPGGVHVESAADANHAAGTRSVLIFPMRKLNQTLIGLKHPRAGRWTITPLPGSAAITGISHANGLPPARVKATVSGRGAHRVLHYRIIPRPGQSVIFAEKAGSVFNVIGAARGSVGSIGFSPAIAHRGLRAILAEVSLAGAPSQQIVAGHYIAPAPPRAAKPARLRARRRGTTILVSWHRAANAHAYVIAATLSDGRRLAYTSRTTQVAITHVGAALTGRVRVAGLGPDGNPGSYALARITARRVPARARSIAVRHSRRGVVVHWKPVHGAVRYLVRVAVAGHTLVVFTRGSSLRPSRALLRGGRVEIRALNSAGQLGAPAVVRVRR